VTTHLGRDWHPETMSSTRSNSDADFNIGLPDGLDEHPDDGEDDRCSQETQAEALPGIEPVPESPELFHLPPLLFG